MASDPQSLDALRASARALKRKFPNDTTIVSVSNIVIDNVTRLLRMSPDDPSYQPLADMMKKNSRGLHDAVARRADTNSPQ